MSSEPRGQDTSFRPALEPVDLGRWPRWLLARLKMAGLSPGFYRAWSHAAVFEGLQHLHPSSYSGLLDHGGRVAGRSGRVYLVGEPYQVNAEAVATACSRLRLRSFEVAESTWNPGGTRRVYLWPAEWGDLDPHADCTSSSGVRR